MTQQDYDPWVVCSRSNVRARLRLFCFPYAGAGASIFSHWSQSLPPEVEVYAVELPGRASRFGEPPRMCLAVLVDELIQALTPYLDVPFLLFGHCLGALISFELARGLKACNAPIPRKLLVAAHCAPQYLNMEKYQDGPAYELPDNEFIEELKRFNGTPESILQNKPLLRLLMPVLRADFALSETYTFMLKEPLDCALSAYGGLEDTTVKYTDMIAWREHITGEFSLHMLPGDHFFLHKSQDKLLQIISQELDELLHSLL